MNDIIINKNPSDKVISGQDKPPQKTFAQYVIQTALDQIDALSDSLIAIQASTHKVEKNTITNLAFLIREKTQNIKNFVEEMSQENRSLARHEPMAGERAETAESLEQSEAKNPLFEAIMRWYDKEAKKSE